MNKANKALFIFNLILIGIFLSGIFVSKVKNSAEAAPTQDNNSSNTLIGQTQAEEESGEAEAYVILRPDQNGQWYILDDSGHTPFNIASVEQNSTFITIYYESPMEDIHWSNVDADESLVIMDIQPGASVGRENAKIYLAKDGKIVNPSDIKSPLANIWVYIAGEY
jgi:hypothetical protein